MTDTGALVLVVEDEPQLRKFLRTSLEVHGFRLVEAATAGEALIAATTHNPELILMDLGLPDGDGLTLVRRIREWSRVPVLVLSARGREDDKVAALDAGADDYLTKPFGVNELLARMRVALRHAHQAAGPQKSETFTFGAVVLDAVKREVTKGGVELKLTPTEYRLLLLLAQNAGRVLTHRQILQAVWGPGHAEQVHTVRVHMAELRKKVEDSAAQPRWLVTEPGVGYRLREVERAEG